MEFAINRSKLVLVEGDITKVPAGAIVNAANSRLAGGGGAGSMGLFTEPAGLRLWRNWTR